MDKAQWLKSWVMSGAGGETIDYIPKINVGLVVPTMPTIEENAEDTSA